MVSKEEINLSNYRKELEFFFILSEITGGQVDCTGNYAKKARKRLNTLNYLNWESIQQ